MGTTKESVAAAGAVSDQQALVQLLLAKTTTKPVKHLIPGGRHMFKEGNEMNIKQLEAAVYTWLRRVRDFDECKICFSSTPTKYKTKTIRTIDFPTEMASPIWMIPAKGKSYLARVMAEQIAKGGLVSVTAKKDGLYVEQEPSGELSPGSSDWEPYVEFVRGRKPEYSVY
jgi:hypothetical protein